MSPQTNVGKQQYSFPPHCKAVSSKANQLKSSAVGEMGLSGESQMNTYRQWETLRASKKPQKNLKLVHTMFCICLACHRHHLISAHDDASTIASHTTLVTFVTLAKGEITHFQHKHFVILSVANVFLQLECFVEKSAFESLIVKSNNMEQASIPGLLVQANLYWHNVKKSQTTEDGNHCHHLLRVWNKPCTQDPHPAL